MCIRVLLKIWSRQRMISSSQHCAFRTSKPKKKDDMISVLIRSLWSTLYNAKSTISHVTWSINRWSQEQHRLRWDHGRESFLFHFWVSLKVTCILYLEKSQSWVAGMPRTTTLTCRWWFLLHLPVFTENPVCMCLYLTFCFEYFFSSFGLMI